jgi:hypothetical protein
MDGPHITNSFKEIPAGLGQKNFDHWGRKLTTFGMHIVFTSFVKMRQAFHTNNSIINMCYNLTDFNVHT